MPPRRERPDGNAPTNGMDRIVSFFIRDEISAIVKSKSYRNLTHIKTALLFTEVEI
jgi:hypothetical protein